MAEQKAFLQTAYEVENTDQTRTFYGNWAASYDQEIGENGYATPRRCADALAKFSPDKSLPVLDFGCGTGLSGLALREQGFDNIDGCDLSPEMLAVAGARTGLYRHLWEADVENPFPFDPGTYAAIQAVGVIAASHAPAETIDQILSVLPPEGLFVFSLNDHTLQDPAFEARVVENIDTGFARLLLKEHGDHLPGINLKSKVYILQKT